MRRIEPPRRQEQPRKTERKKRGRGRLNRQGAKFAKGKRRENKNVENINIKN
jgi:hypothetical protein